MGYQYPIFMSYISHMNDEKIDMFMLTPLIFNSSYMREDLHSIYTLSIPISEMEEVKSEEELHNLLFYHYYELFYKEDEDRTEEKRIEFYFNKKQNQQLIEGEK